METSYILTFIGDDRPGLVEELSTVIESNRGNWHESRLAQLGGKFAGLILVTLPTASAAKLEAELKALAATGLSVRVTPTDTVAADMEGHTSAGHTSAGRTSAGHTITLSVVGPDRLGIVREISRALAARQINVVEMDSAVESAAMSGELLFRARIDAQIPPDTDLEDLHDSLEEVANHMTLDIDLE